MIEIKGWIIPAIYVQVFCLERVTFLASKGCPLPKLLRNCYLSFFGF